MAKTYLIYRYGSDPRNQPEVELLPVAIVTAPDPEQAKRLAVQLDTLYESQSLIAIPEEDADPEDWILVGPHAVLD